MKKRVFDIIQIGYRDDTASRLFDYFIVVTIVISIGITFALTFPMQESTKFILDKIEFVTIVIFIVEYILRIWTAEYLFPNFSRPRAIFKFFISFYGIVDLLTILSYFAPLYSNGIVALRMIRVIRIMRLFQVNRTSDAFNVIAEVLTDKRKQLTSSIFMIAMIMLAASLVMFGFEHESQPEVFSNGFSGIWWAMSTILTVGYGDIYPITVGGKIIAILIAILGVCVVAIPTGVISAGFVQYYARLREADRRAFISDYALHLLHSEADKHDMPDDRYLIYLLEKEQKLEKETAS